jgi:hypothetical protein
VVHIRRKLAAAAITANNLHSMKTHRKVLQAKSEAHPESKSKLMNMKADMRRLFSRRTANHPKYNHGTMA